MNFSIHLNQLRLLGHPMTDGMTKWKTQDASKAKSHRIDRINFFSLLSGKYWKCYWTDIKCRLLYENSLSNI